MIIELPDTDTTAINKTLRDLRERLGAATLGRVLTLIIVAQTEAVLEESLAASNAAGREHPSRVIAVLPADPDTGPARLDAQLRIGGDSGAGETLVLRLCGPLAAHAANVVVPFLLPDIPVVAWWPELAPPIPAADPVGRLAVRRITDATNDADPRAAISGRLAGYTPGDTDLAWSRITYWRALLASALDQPPYEPVSAALVSGLRTEPALDVLAGWLAGRIDGPVRRAVGELKVELTRRSETVTLSRPQEGITATLRRTGRPDALLPLARRDVRECLTEDLRRLDADDIYFSALQGIDRVEYL